MRPLCFLPHRSSSHRPRSVAHLNPRLLNDASLTTLERVLGRAQHGLVGLVVHANELFLSALRALVRQGSDHLCSAITGPQDGPGYGLLSSRLKFEQLSIFTA